MASVCYCPHCGTQIHTTTGQTKKCLGCGRNTFLTIDADGDITIKSWEEPKRPWQKNLRDLDMTRRQWNRSPSLNPEFLERSQKFKPHQPSPKPVDRLPHSRPTIVIEKRPRIRPLEQIRAENLVWREVPKSPNTPLENGLAAGFASLVVIILALIAFTSSIDFQWTADAVISALLLAVILPVMAGFLTFFKTKPADHAKSEDHKNL